MARLLPVRAVNFLWNSDILAASNGRGIDFYSTEERRLISSFEALESHSVHGIEKLSKECDGNEELICIYGGCEIAIYTVKLGVGVVHKKMFSATMSDWICCAQPLYTPESQECSSIGCGLSSNTVVEWKFDGNRRLGVAPAKALLYSMSLYGGTWDVLIAASGTIFSPVLVWEVSTGSLLTTLRGHNGSIMRVVFQNEFLLSASDDRMMKLWNWRDGNCLTTYSGHSARVWNCSFIKDSAIVVSASEDNTCMLWDRSGKCVGKVEGHTGRGIWGICVCEKRQLVATGGTDCTVKIWDARKWLAGRSPGVAFNADVACLHKNDPSNATLFTAIAVDSAIDLVVVGSSSGDVYYIDLKIEGSGLTKLGHSQTCKTRVDNLVIVHDKEKLFIVTTWESGASDSLLFLPDRQTVSVPLIVGQRALMCTCCSEGSKTLFVKNSLHGPYLCIASYDGRLMFFRVDPLGLAWERVCTLQTEIDKQRVVCASVACVNNGDSGPQFLVVGGTLNGSVALHVACFGEEPISESTRPPVDDTAEEIHLFEPLCKRNRVQVTGLLSRLHPHRNKAVTSVQFLGTEEKAEGLAMSVLSCGMDGTVCTYLVFLHPNGTTCSNLQLISQDVSYGRALGGLVAMQSYSCGVGAGTEGLCVGMKGHQFSVWDLKTNTKITEQQSSTNRKFLSCHFNTTDRTSMIIGWLHNHDLRVLRYPSNQPEFIEHARFGISYHAKEVYDIHWIPGDMILSHDMILSCSEDCEISLVTIDGRASLPIPRVHQSSVRCASLCQTIWEGECGWLLACGGGKSALSLWFIPKTLSRVKPLTSCVIKSARNVHFRIMSIQLLRLGDSAAYLLCGCSDAAVRCMHVKASSGISSVLQGRGCLTSCPGPVLAIAHAAIDETFHIFFGCTSGDVSHIEIGRDTGDDIISEKTSVCQKRLHQAGVNALEVFFHPPQSGRGGEGLIFSAGDDQSIRVTRWCRKDGFLESAAAIQSCAAFRKLKIIVLPSAFRILAVAGDQRLYGFSCVEEDGKPSIVSSEAILVEVQALAALAVHPECKQVAVAGQGLQVFAPTFLD